MVRWPLPIYKGARGKSDLTASKHGAIQTLVRFGGRLAEQLPARQLGIELGRVGRLGIDLGECTRWPGSAPPQPPIIDADTRHLAFWKLLGVRGVWAVRPMRR